MIQKNKTWYYMNLVLGALVCALLLTINYLLRRGFRLLRVAFTRRSIDEQ